MVVAPLLVGGSALKSRPCAAFHSLSDADKANIRELPRQELNLRQVALRVGCNYKHAWAFAHAAELIDYRPHVRNDHRISRAIALIRAGTTVYAVANRLGLAVVLCVNAQKNEG